MRFDLTTVICCVCKIHYIKHPPYIYIYTFFFTCFFNFLHLEITGLLDEFSLKLLRRTLYLQVGFRRYRKQPELDVVTCCDFHLRTYSISARCFMKHVKACQGLSLMYLISQTLGISPTPIIVSLRLMTMKRSSQ